MEVVSLVFVLDKHKKPLMPCSEKRARKLLEVKRAVVHRIIPFAIRLKDRTLEESKTQPLRLKLDPGSKTTGVAVIEEPNKVVFLGEVGHKPGIKNRLDTRRACRKSRRFRKTRYRQTRFLNRKRVKGWLPPSLEARVNQTINAVAKFRAWSPITAISSENVKFDTQKMQNPEISGVKYQQGELQGYEVREYLLEKWGRKCAYCGKTNVPLEIEHIIPKSRGGTNRVSNLTLACHDCNDKKDRLTAAEFGHPEIQAQAKESLKDAGIMNATRWKLRDRLKETNLPVECGTGARTKKQRIEHDLPKTHFYDACCVGASTPASLRINTRYMNKWQSLGRGGRQMSVTDKYGFPRYHKGRSKCFYGFRTGDFIVATISKGSHMGTWNGYANCRSRGEFDIKNSCGDVMLNGVGHKHCRVLQYADGWRYGARPLQNSVKEVV